MLNLIINEVNNLSAERNPARVRYVLGDTPYSSFTMFTKQTAPRGVRNSLVERYLRPPNWSRVHLPAFEKNFYREHFSTSQRSPAEVDAYREAKKISVLGNGVPKPLLSIEEAGFPGDLMEAIQALKQISSSSISRLQAQCWPVALSGRDLLAIVEGEPQGKTLGYLLPAIVHIRHQEPVETNDGPIALVLTDSHECAQEVEQVARNLQKYTRIRVVCLYSGVPKGPQLNQLQEGAEIWVAAPGRLVSLMQECKVSLRRCTYLVVDDADRMVAVGFQKQLRIIAENVRPDRQTLMWATSRSMDVDYFAEELLTDHVTVTIGAWQAGQSQRVEQVVLIREKSEKESAIVDLFQETLRDDGDKAIVFVEMRQTVDELVARMRCEGLSAVGIHGNKTEGEQAWALSAFRFRKVAVLVATDTVARHIEADGVRFVVSYDYPRYAEDYTRRVKLAVRPDGTGRVYTFLAPTDSRRAKELVRILRESEQVPSPELLKLARCKVSAGKSGARHSRPLRSRLLLED